LSLVGLLQDLHRLGLVQLLSLLMSNVKSSLLFLLLLDPLGGKSLEPGCDERSRLALLLLLLSLLLGKLVGLNLSLEKLDLLILRSQDLLLIREVDAVWVHLGVIELG
jgi:hypothetical protein